MRCVTGIGSTLMLCGNKHMKQMWTFNQKRNECVTTTIDTCNHHFGNIFQTESECIGTCVLAPKIETSKPARKKYITLTLAILAIIGIKRISLMK